jgi:hypothetical protein
VPRLVLAGVLAGGLLDFAFEPEAFVKASA